MCVSFIQFSKHVKKKIFYHVHKENVINWPSHLNEIYIFNVEESFSYRGKFEPSILQSFFFTSQSMVLVPRPPLYAQPVEKFMDELHKFVRFEVPCCNLVRRRDRLPWLDHILGDNL